MQEEGKGAGLSDSIKRARTKGEVQGGGTKREGKEAELRERFKQQRQEGEEGPGQWKRARGRTAEEV